MTDAAIIKLLLTIISVILTTCGGIALGYWRDKINREDKRDNKQQIFNEMVQEKWGELTIENTKTLGLVEANQEKIGVLFKKVTTVEAKQSAHNARISKLES